MPVLSSNPVAPLLPSITSSPVSFMDKLNQGMGFGTTLLLTYYQGQEAVNSAQARATAAKYSAVPTYAAQAPQPDELGRYAPYIAGAVALAMVAMALQYSNRPQPSYRR